MPIRSPKQLLISFPPLDISDDEFTLDKHDSPIDFGFDTLTEATEHKGGAMAGAQSPFIKAEPSEYFDLQHAMHFNHHQQQHNNYAAAAAGNPGSMNINPANLSNGFNQNMSSSFNAGNAGIADDELLDLQIDAPQNNNTTTFDFNSGVQNYLNVNTHNSAHAFSHTPDGAPIQSPFTHQDFNYAQFRTMQPHQQQQRHFANASSLPQQSGFQQQTPATPALNLQTPDMNSGMQRIMQHRQRPSLGGGSDWEGTPSGHSWGESSPPFPSPANGLQMQRQISEVLNQRAPKVASSLPAKMEPGVAPPAMQSQEAKRRRRRESHNMVERRRRDNINERIHDLGTLVPQHRLEDEKVRKHLTTNAPLSPSIAHASGVSPPNTSLLSGSGRRATAGNITQGLPIEDKDKGPNKGDILNSSVAWTRDLMWYLKLKLQQEEQIKKTMADMGMKWPFEQTEDEKRMSSEIGEVLGKHTNTGMISEYTRAPGTGLRVPGFTNVAGDSISGGDTSASAFDFNNGSISPGFVNNHSNFNWNDNFNSAPEFKEEDEYDMEV